MVWAPDPGSYTLDARTTFDQGVPGFPRDARPPRMQEVCIRVR